MRKICWLFLLLVSCTEQSTKELRIVSWNVQNLFDLEWQGTEYPEYDPRPSGKAPKWTAELLQYRLKKLSRIVNQLDADIYALIEVESESVLQQLNLELDKPFPYFLLLAQRDQAVNMGLLSRLPIVRSARHEVGFLDAKKSKRQLRAIIEVELKHKNIPEKLVLFLNHWKSQRGGIEQTAAARAKAAEMLEQSARELQAHIIALGDFNEPIDSYWSHRDFSNFWPWDRRNLAKKEVMYISADPLDREAWSGAWFSPWFAYGCKADCRKMGKLAQDIGSYAFRGKWETIDHFFLNSAFFETRGWHFASFSVARFPPLLKEEVPHAWRQNRGIADHLPLVLDLEYR